MDQLDIAIHNTAHNAKGGLSRLAHQIGVGEQVLRNKCNPNCETHKLSLREAVAMMMQAKNVEILNCIAFELGYRLKPANTKSNPINLINAVLRDSAEQGDVHFAIEESLKDNVITPRELNAIRREIAEKHQALSDLEKTIFDHSKTSIVS